jgi:hypothetical protein
MGSEPRTVSLLQELHDMENMITAASLLVDAVENPPYAWAENEVPSALNTVVCWVGDRLRLLMKAMEGEINPTLLWNVRNRAVPEDEGESPFVLREWTPAERLSRAKVEVSSLRAQLKRQSVPKAAHDTQRGKASRAPHKPVKEPVSPPSKAVRAVPAQLPAGEHK